MTHIAIAVRLGSITVGRSVGKTKAKHANIETTCRKQMESNQEEYDTASTT